MRSTTNLTTTPNSARSTIDTTRAPMRSTTPNSARSTFVKDLKAMCKPKILELCEGAGLTDSQFKVINARIIRGWQLRRSSMEIGMSENTITNHFNVALKRLEDYRKHLQTTQTYGNKEV